ncbi:glycosyl hydrolase [Formosa sp. 4Alg 33]|uniref:glycosyl hydrolase n=1 Tax=Formosa sp. 4Alg 33 TaxID=3382189 RepID=UPI003D9C555D
MKLRILLLLNLLFVLKHNAQSSFYPLPSDLYTTNALVVNRESNPEKRVKSLVDMETPNEEVKDRNAKDAVLMIYSKKDFSGEVREVSCGYYNGDLGVYDDWGMSFKLEKGYMATFAQDVNGLGISKVYIAQDHDVAINMPPEFQNSISFIRVSPWFSANKKGASGKGLQITNSLNPSWFYNWGSVGESTADRQFVPMTWSGIPSLSKVEELGRNMGYNNYLAFNEPDGPDQANMTVEEALEGYKNMLASGLRLGAPAVTHENRGIAWLDEFMARCKALNYRVDFIPIHHYVRRTTEGFKTWIEEKVYNKHKLPIWVTEYNYGNANYSALITDEVTLEKLKSINNMLDTTSYIERYSAFYFQPNKGQLTFFSQRSPLILNDTGKYYRDHETPTGYIQEEYK